MVNDFKDIYQKCVLASPGVESVTVPGTGGGEWIRMRGAGENEIVRHLQ